MQTCVRGFTPGQKNWGKSGLGHWAFGPPGCWAVAGRGPAFSKTSEILDLEICEHRIKKQIQLFVDKFVSSCLCKTSPRFCKVSVIYFGFNYLACITTFYFYNLKKVGYFLHAHNVVVVFTEIVNSNSCRKTTRDMTS